MVRRKNWTIPDPDVDGQLITKMKKVKKHRDVTLFQT